jgi:RNA polymerase sigma factor (sigma-70 family)
VASTTERFQELFEAHYRDLMAYAIRRCASPEDAEDLVAETFTVAWRRFDDLPSGNQTRLWLFGTARLIRMNQFRSHRRRRNLLIRLAGLPKAGRVTGSDAVISDREQVLEALRALPPGDREILQLHAWEQLSADEIAIVLDLTPSAVWKRLERARRRLAASLEGPQPPEAVPVRVSPLGRPTRKAAQ